MDLIEQRLPEHVSGVWEQLASQSAPHLDIGGQQWKAGRRWWGNGRDGKPFELDFVAESFDGSALLIAEMKWENSTHVGKVAKKLLNQIENFPLVKGRNGVPAVWVKHSGRQKKLPGIHLVTPEETLACLK